MNAKNTLRNPLTTLFRLSFVLAILIGGLASCNDDGASPDTAPKDLLYSPASLSTDEGTAATSAKPSITSATTPTYSMTSTPDAGGEITIDAATGILTATANLKAGNYSVNVSATNSVGTTNFTNAFSVEVKAVTKTTYKSDIQPIIVASCSPCHVYGGAQINFGSSYNNTKNKADAIIDRINRMQGSTGFMPYQGTKLDAATIAKIEKWKTDGLLEE